MPEHSEREQSGDTQTIPTRALRVLATAQLRQAQYELAQAHLLKAMERAELLRAGHFALANQLRQTVASIAKEELAAGKSPVHMVLLLHEIVNEAIPNRQIRSDVESDVVQWGIEAYFAA